MTVSVLVYVRTCVFVCVTYKSCANSYVHEYLYECAMLCAKANKCMLHFLKYLLLLFLYTRRCTPGGVYVVCIYRHAR